MYCHDIFISHVQSLPDIVIFYDKNHYNVFRSISVSVWVLSNLGRGNLKT